MSTPYPLLRLALGAASMLALAAPGSAHHSYAMFDGRAKRTSEGTVARFEWTNPHIFLWVYLPPEDGGQRRLLALESDSVNQLRRQGWSRDSFSAGQRVTVTWYPLRDGRLGGHLVSARLADGSTLSGALGPITAIEVGSRQGPQP